nr:MAG TPA: 33 kDa chaperonin [Caudoviricetes sp.]
MKIEDLLDGSNAIVEATCDYCGEKYTTTWKQYTNLKKTVNKKDCCKRTACKVARMKETMLLKYGVENARQLPYVNEKIK